MACQICFDESALLAGNASIGGALCCRACPARVCVLYLARHIEVTLVGYYAGMLPVIRCPVCAVPMRMDRWLQPLKSTFATAGKAGTLHNEYNALSERACSLTAPCCGNVYYTHLPFGVCYDVRSKTSPRFIEYNRLVTRFCGHRVDAQDIIAFSIDRFGVAATHGLVERTLRRISDWERHARLLIAYLPTFPKTPTRFCLAAICFRCKRAGHHDMCEDLSLAVVDPNKFILRCRNCRVLFTKGEGCNHVRCICGHDMSWKSEVARQEEDRAHGRLIPANPRLSGRTLLLLKAEARRTLVSLHAQDSNVRRRR